MRFQYIEEQGYQNRDAANLIVGTSKSRMGTPNSFSGYPAVGAPGNNQQLAPGNDLNRYHQQMASLYVPPYQCICNASQGQYHLQQCIDYNLQRNQFVLQAHQQHQSYEQPWSVGSGQSLGEQAPQLRSPQDYEMKVLHENSSSSNGGQIEEAENFKQPAPQDEPMEEETGREANDGGAQLNSTAPLNSTEQHQGVPEHGPQHGDPYGVSNEDEHSAAPEVHPCCGTACLKYDSNNQLGYSAPSHLSNEKKSGSRVGDSGWRWLWRGSNEERGHNRPDSSRKERESELSRKLAELEDKLNQHSADSNKVAKRKDEELTRKIEELTQAKSEIARLTPELEKYRNAVKSHESQVIMLTTKVTEYKAIADKVTAQLSSLEQSNSKAVGGTGAHKDTPAIPPNLVKAVFVVHEAALTCTKAFINFLKERQALEKLEAWQNVPVGADDRYRKYAMEAYLCSRLFAGFENDSYLDSLDCAQSSERYLPPNYKEKEFFLLNQDAEKRRQRYLAEYEYLQNRGLQKIMDKMKTTKAQVNHPFFFFCCRKFVNIVSSMDSWFEEFELLQDIDYSRESLLHQFASNPKYCETFLKPFVNLTLVTFLLHRLAFQFQPPARIFRYARGTRFDPIYMENAFPIDDDDSDEEFVVGLMLVPGFQVGATIVKCNVYLVPSSTITSKT